MKTEDEIHEFDTIIQRFKIASSFIDRILNSKLDETLIKKYIRKIKNIRILNIIYEKKTHQILDLALQHPKEIFPMIKERLD